MSQKKLLVTSIFDNEKIEAEEVKKSKIERAFDRLESIADGQKKAIQKLRTALIKNNISK